MAATVRQDIHQTSTGVGHHWRPGYYFPSSNFKTVYGDPLPSTLAQPNQVPKDDQFKTTTGQTHDLKHIGGPYGNSDPLHRKAPGHWKVNYVKDLHEKLQPGSWRKPLTMGNQTSETHEQYRAQPAMPTEPTEFVPRPPHNYILDGHHKDGPSKQVLPNTQNDKLKGKPFYVKDRAVFDLNDPYMTTNHKVHRRFTPKELDKYPKKDVATYWQCEDYPKAWGHGTKHNPLPKDSIPHPRPPMRDEMIFKSETQVRRIPNSMTAVPHGCQKSLYSECYQRPSDVKMREMYYTPVDTPYNLPAPGPRSAFAAPNMYNTEYKNIGSRKPVAI